VSTRARRRTRAAAEGKQRELTFALESLKSKKLSCKGAYVRHGVI